MTGPSVGLTTREAREWLQQIGPNAAVDIAQHPMWRALNKLRAPVPWMLEAAILLQLGLGDYVLVLDAVKSISFHRLAVV